ncbi:hypothetical protein PRK78_002927 [Emydomyces testavorans]|uniref:Uncharacterized protein n=1 Tax=Emydomyces testavorans TaxID=2070801 RepID=A0AAF0IGZ4_9EURO|nr:hypothetical protein PRK78_002927 [Emydomyces testavorans]
MWLIRLYCSLFLLLPVVLSAPLSQSVVSAEGTRWGGHGNDASVRVTLQQSTLTEKKHGNSGDSREISPNIDVLTRAAKSRPGDRWPYALSSLTSDMIKELDASVKDVVSSKISERRPVSTLQVLNLDGTRPSSKTDSSSTHELVSDPTQARRLKTIKYRYLTLFSRSKEQSAPAKIARHEVPSKPEKSSPRSASAIGSDERMDFYFLLTQIFGRPIWAWTAIFLSMFILFILSVIIREIMTALSSIVKSRLRKSGSQRIRLEGAEQKITAV